jgi:FixJ family two-component response regulator
MNTPTVYSIDVDVSVHESLESPIDCTDWRSQTYASARDFLGFLERLHAPVPGCPVLDVGLPDLDGPQPQRRLNRGRPHLPVISMAESSPGPTTAKAHRGRVMRKMRAGSVADLVRMAARLGIPEAL